MRDQPGIVREARYAAESGTGIADPNLGSLKLILCFAAMILLSGTLSTHASGPIAIIHGGTFHGEWSSDSCDTPVVTIHTTEPVILDRCVLTGPGILIESRVDHSDITIRNCRGTGLNPDVAGQCAGRFIEDESFDRIHVEHCELSHTAGIYLRECLGKPRLPSDQLIRIIGNRAVDIDGRKSDGHGGYLDFNLRTNLSTHQTESGFSEVQFLQLDGVHAIVDVEIAWNHIFNEPGRSRVEDNINLYNSSGAIGRPISIHDNCVCGAYTVNPAASSKTDGIFNYDWSFSGGGIMLGDGEAKEASDRSSFIEAVNNVVIGTTNYGIAISAGRDISMRNNVIVSCGRLPGGQPIADQNVGAYIWNVYKPNRTTPSTFTNNGGSGNVVGWVEQGTRNDWWTPDAAWWTGNMAMKGPITIATEDAAERQWQARADQAHVEIGIESNRH